MKLGFNTGSLNTLLVVTTLVAFAQSESAGASVVDFETIPGFTPTEGMQITDQFEASHGITFSMSSGNAPILAEVGGTRYAFQGPGNGNDNPAPGQDVGQFFLTDDGVGLGLSGQLVITYTTEVAAASGALLDIDHEESWTIEAIGSAGVVLESITLSDPASPGIGDGVATTWSFSRSAEDIKQLVFTGTKPDQSAFGLAFDNFSPATAEVPIPSAVILFGSAFLGLSGIARGRGKKA